MPEMPTLGAPPKQSPLIPMAITAVVVGCLTGGIFWFRGPNAEPTPTEKNDAAAVVPAGDPTAQVAPVDLPTSPVSNPEAVLPAVVAEKRQGMRAFQVRINGPLESTIINSEGKEVGAPLTQVVNRSLVWWMRVPQELVKGDTLAVVYETRDGQEPLVHAVRFESQRRGRIFETYRFQSPDGSARYYQPDFTELEERLIDAPLDTYEQVTSLLRDGRKHKGVDFKTPVGTSIKAPFDGVVTRKNWNFRGNGNSVEIREIGGQGRLAMFLHLSEVPKTLTAGQHIKRGEVFAKSGNTGHSFAPHLHYQLMKGDKVIDPFVSHETKRISLPAAERKAFEARMGELKALIPTMAVAGG